jgi:hypothetical protein
MVLQITPGQSRRVSALVLRLCCNYDHGNCLLLDDGEKTKCGQLISKYRIYCNYFENAVLQANKELHEEILQQNKSKS